MILSLRNMLASVALSFHSHFSQSSMMDARITITNKTKKKDENVYSMRAEALTWSIMNRGLQWRKKKGGEGEERKKEEGRR